MTDPRWDGIEAPAERFSTLAVLKDMSETSREHPCEIQSCLEPAVAWVRWIIGPYGEASLWYCEEHRPPGEVTD